MRPPVLNPRQIGKFVVLCVSGVVVVYVLIMLFIAKPAAPAAVSQPNVDEFEETIIAVAKQAYAQAKESGIDLTTGPCLSDALEIGWAIDIAHFPRETIDDWPENQCIAYLEGKVQHFIELDTRGAVIRLK